MEKYGHKKYCQQRRQIFWKTVIFGNICHNLSNSAKNLVLLALAATPNFFQPGSARLAARGPAM